MSFRWNLSSSLRRLSLAFLPQVSWSSLSSSHTFWKGRSSIGLPASSIPTKRPLLGCARPRPRRACGSRPYRRHTGLPRFTGPSSRRPKGATLKTLPQPVGAHERRGRIEGHRQRHARERRTAERQGCRERQRPPGAALGYEHTSLPCMRGVDGWVGWEVVESWWERCIFSCGSCVAPPTARSVPTLRSLPRSQR